MSVDYLIASAGKTDPGMWSVFLEIVRIGIPVLALGATIWIAVANNMSNGRRHKNDVVRTAINDLSTGRVARARDELSSVLASRGGEHPAELPLDEKNRALYFELCWAYQRGSAALGIWGKPEKESRPNKDSKIPFGVDDLDYHLKQIASSIQQFHNWLNDYNAESINDEHIWKRIGDSAYNDCIALGVVDPKSNKSFYTYYEKSAKAELK